MPLQPTRAKTGIQNLLSAGGAQDRESSRTNQGSSLGRLSHKKSLSGKRDQTPSDVASQDRRGGEPRAPRVRTSNQMQQSSGSFDQQFKKHKTGKLPSFGTADKAISKRVAPFDGQRTLKGVKFDQDHEVSIRGGPLPNVTKLVDHVTSAKRFKNHSDHHLIEEISDEEGFEFLNHLEKFVEYVRVEDSSIAGRITTLVRVRDPCTGHLMATIRNPQIDINPYRSMAGVIDMQQAIIDNKEPTFSSSQEPVCYDERRLGWHVMLELINSGASKEQFWTFIERLRQVRLTYNQILLNKFRALAKRFKSNFDVQKLFNSFAIDVRSPFSESEESGGGGSGSKPGKKDDGTAKPHNERESNATKATKLIEEFMAKVGHNGQAGQAKKNDTVLSGSVKDESHDDLRQGSHLSTHLRDLKTRKSSANQASKSELSSKDAATLMDETLSKGVLSTVLGKTTVQADDQSDAGMSAIYSRKLAQAGTGGGKRRGGIVKDSNEHSSAIHHRLGKRDLVPSNNQYHKLASINEFISNNFDSYAREYGEYFQDELTVFEDKLEALKREIQLNLLSEKRTNSSGVQGQASQQAQAGDQSARSTHIDPDLESKLLLKEQEEQQRALESKKFPSLAYLRKMGVNSFKPSISHKVQSGQKVFNILNDPMIALVSPRIDCQWEGGHPPRMPIKKKLDNLDSDSEEDVDLLREAEQPLGMEAKMRKIVSSPVTQGQRKSIRMIKMSNSLRTRRKLILKKAKTGVTAKHSPIRDFSRDVGDSEDAAPKISTTGGVGKRRKRRGTTICDPATDSMVQGCSQSYESISVNTRGDAQGSQLFSGMERKAKDKQFRPRSNTLSQATSDKDRIVSPNLGVVVTPGKRQGLQSPTSKVMHDNSFADSVAGQGDQRKRTASLLLQHSISAHEKSQAWKLTQGRRAMVENQNISSEGATLNQNDDCPTATRDISALDESPTNQPGDTSAQQTQMHHNSSLSLAEVDRTVASRAGSTNGVSNVIIVRDGSKELGIIDDGSTQGNELESDQGLPAATCCSQDKLPKFKIKASRIQSAKNGNQSNGGSRTVQKRNTFDINRRSGFDHALGLSSAGIGLIGGIAHFNKFRGSQVLDPSNGLLSMEKNQDLVFKKLKARHWRAPTCSTAATHQYQRSGLKPTGGTAGADKLPSSPMGQAAMRRKVSKRRSEAQARLKSFLDEKPLGKSMKLPPPLFWSNQQTKESQEQHHQSPSVYQTPSHGRLILSENQQERRAMDTADGAGEDGHVYFNDLEQVTQTMTPGGHLLDWQLSPPTGTSAASEHYYKNMVTQQQVQHHQYDSVSKQALFHNLEANGEYPILNSENSSPSTHFQQNQRKMTARTLEPLEITTTHGSQEEKQYTQLNNTVTNATARTKATGDLMSESYLHRAHNKTNVPWALNSSKNTQTSGSVKQDQKPSKVLTFGTRQTSHTKKQKDSLMSPPSLRSGTTQHTTAALNTTVRVKNPLAAKGQSEAKFGSIEARTAGYRVRKGKYIVTSDQTSPQKTSAERVSYRTRDSSRRCGNQTQRVGALTTKSAKGRTLLF